MEDGVLCTSMLIFEECKDRAVRRFCSLTRCWPCTPQLPARTLAKTPCTRQALLICCGMSGSLPRKIWDYLPASCGRLVPLLGSQRKRTLNFGNCQISHGSLEASGFTVVVSRMFLQLRPRSLLNPSCELRRKKHTGRAGSQKRVLFKRTWLGPLQRGVLLQDPYLWNALSVAAKCDVV